MLLDVLSHWILEDTIAAILTSSVHQNWCAFYQALALLEGKGQLTPVANSQRLFPSGIEHGGNDKETGCDRTFASSQNKTNDEKSGEILASSVAQQSD